jgi:hypothetical protein
VARRKSAEEIAEAYQVTLAMTTFRLHSTGVALQLGREARSGSPSLNISSLC